MLKTKPTCVELRYLEHSYDEYCYDPSLVDQPKEVILSWVVETQDRSWLALSRVLPNPAGRDIVSDNELVGLSRSGQDGLVMDKSLKLKLWRSTMSLSGIVLHTGETVFAASKAIPNGPSCIELVRKEQTIDRICYPQAPDDVRYYHPRLGKGPETLPAELMQELDFDVSKLSKLRLAKTPDKKVCMMYDSLAIQCVWATQTPTAIKDRALLTLNNAYIATIHDLYYRRNLSSLSLQHYLRSYLTLSARIKSGDTSKLSVRGMQINPQSLWQYNDLVYRDSPSDYLVHELGSTLLGDYDMLQYYDQVYASLN